MRARLLNLGRHKKARATPMLFISGGKQAAILAARVLAAHGANARARRLYEEEPKNRNPQDFENDLFRGTNPPAQVDMATQRASTCIV